MRFGGCELSATMISSKCGLIQAGTSDFGVDLQVLNPSSPSAQLKSENIVEIVIEEFEVTLIEFVQVPN